MTYPRVTVSHKSTIPKSHSSPLTTTIHRLWDIFRRPGNSMFRNCSAQTQLVLEASSELQAHRDILHFRAKVEVVQGSPAITEPKA